MKILVVDDHFMVRMGLSSSLNAEEDMEVIAETGSGEDSVNAYRQHRPNLVLMDVRLPKMSGPEAVAAIMHEFPGACILMLSTHSGEEEIYRSLRAGARGYILKSAMREELLRAIRQVRDGKRYLDASGGAAVSCLGHGDRRVAQAIRQQLDSLAYTHTSFFTTGVAEDLADRLS